MPINIIFQIWYELTYRKCYFHKLNAFKMKHKTMFAPFFRAAALFWLLNSCQALLNKLNRDAYYLESWTRS